jgi:hypothetical protein
MATPVATPQEESDPVTYPMFDCARCGYPTYGEAPEDICWCANPMPQSWTRSRPRRWPARVTGGKKIDPDWDC